MKAARFLSIALSCCLLVVGVSLPASAAEGLSVKSLSVNRLGNTGEGTLIIIGEKFDRDTVFSIVPSSGAACAQVRGRVFGEDRAIATFDLNGVNPGPAEVKAVSGSAVSSLTGNLVISGGLEAKVELYLDSPERLKAGETAAIQVMCYNSGHLDAPLPLLVLKVPGAEYLGRTPDGENLGESALILGIPESPVYPILRPGEVSVTQLYLRVPAPSEARLFSLPLGDAALEGVAFDYSKIAALAPSASPEAVASYTAALQGDYGENLKEYYEKALLRLETLAQDRALSADLQMENIDGKWFLERSRPSVGSLQSGMLSFGAVGIPDTSPNILPPVALSGDGIARTWVVIVSGSNYGEFERAGYFTGGSAGEKFYVSDFPQGLLEGERVYDLFNLVYHVPSSQITWVKDSAPQIDTSIRALQGKADGDDTLIVWYIGRAIPPVAEAKYPGGSWMLGDGGVYTASDLSAALDFVGSGANRVFSDGSYSGGFVDSLTSVNTQAHASCRAGELGLDDALGGSYFSSSLTAKLAAGEELESAFETKVAECFREMQPQVNTLTGLPTGGLISSSMWENFFNESIWVSVRDVVLPVPPEAGKWDFTFQAPTYPSFLPGGFAICPWDKVYYVSDNTNGRIFRINPRMELPFRSITLISGLDKPGDVDIGDHGTSLVYTDGNWVRKKFFGFSIRLVNSAGEGVAGAEVVAQTPIGERVGRTDTEGWLTMMDLLRPGGSRKVQLTVRVVGFQAVGYGFELNEQCHTVYEARWDPALAFSTITPPLSIPFPAVHFTPAPPAEQVYQVSVTEGQSAITVTEFLDYPPGPAPRKIVILSPADGLKTGSSTQIVKGIVNDSSITEVSIEINGTSYTAAVSGGQFSLEVPLASGSNEILAKGRDGSGAMNESEPSTVYQVPGFSEGTGAVSGQVVDSRQCLGIPGVRVREQKTGRETTTDESGYYSFLELPEGRASIEIER